MAADPIPFQLGGQFQADASTLARKQQLIDALTAKSQQAPQGQMVSGHYISPGILGALLPLAQSLAANHAETGVLRGQQKLSSQYQGAVGQALKSYMDQRNGVAATPGQVQTGGGPTMSTDDAANMMGGDQAPTYSQPATTPAQPAIAPTAETPADPRGAAMQALASAFPQIQAVGKMDLEQLNKGAVTPHDVFTNSDLSVPSRVAALGSGQGTNGTVNLSGVQAAPKTITANDQVFNAVPGGPVTPVLDARTKYGQFGQVAQTPNGPLYGQAADTGKIETPPPGTNINLNTVDSASNAFAKGIADARAQSLVQSRTNAIDGVKALSQINDAQAALSNGIKTGSGADFKLTLAKVGKAFGLSDDPAIVNSEGYKAAVMNQVLGSVKTLGSNPSEADREFVNQIKGGTLNLDAGTLQHLLQVAKASAGNDVLAHQHNLAINRDATGAIPADMDAMNVPFNFSAPDLEFDSGTGRLRAPILQPQSGSPKVMHFNAQGELIQ